MGTMELRAALTPGFSHELRVGVGRLLCFSSSPSRRGWRWGAALLVLSRVTGCLVAGGGKVLQLADASKGGAEHHKDGSLWVRRSYDARQKGRVFVCC